MNQVDSDSCVDCEKEFKEHSDLIKKWFQEWSIRKQEFFIKDLVSLCKEQRGDVLTPTRQQRNDILRSMPQPIVLRVFSHLDPRSLSRCAQVCWYWKWLAENEDLWKSKCLKLGWYLSPVVGYASPNQWKQLFIANLTRLQTTTNPVVAHPMWTVDTSTMTDDVHPKVTTMRTSGNDERNPSARPKPSEEAKTSNSAKYSNRFQMLTAQSSTSVTSSLQSEMSRPRKSAPWRSSARKPTELVRYNYLDNCE